MGENQEILNLRFHVFIFLVSGIRPYKCPVVGCTATFANRSLIKSHKKYIHENVRPFVCDICGRNFKEKKSLRVHLNYHAEPKIPCTICGKMQYTS